MVLCPLATAGIAPPGLVSPSQVWQYYPVRNVFKHVLYSNRHCRLVWSGDHLLKGTEKTFWEIGRKVAICWVRPKVAILQLSQAQGCQLRGKARGRVFDLSLIHI